MTRWEYKIVDSKDTKSGIFRGPDRAKVEASLNELGAKGWDLIGVDFRELEERMSFIAIAKRPVDER